LKLTKRVIISTCLILLAFVFSFSTLTGFSLGDKVFLIIGISPWTNGQTGFHNTILVTFTLMVIGILEAKREMTGRRLLALIVLCILFTPWVASMTRTLYYKTQTGLAAVEYDYANSHFYLRNSDDKKDIEVTGFIVLTNYGRNPVKVGIKIPSDNLTHHNWFTEDIVLKEADNAEEIFYLSPGEKRSIWTFSSIPVQNTSYQGHGSMNGPNLILYNDDETRNVGDHV
jgi:hypothetical protein